MNTSKYHELNFFDTETFKEGTLDVVIGSFLSCNNASTKRKEHENSLLQPMLSARTPASSLLRKTYRSTFPVFNVKRRSEPVATATAHSHTSVADGGSTCAQLFVVTKTLVTDIYGMKTDKKFVNTLEDNIRIRGDMDKLILDSAQSKISNRVKDTLSVLSVDYC